MDDDWGMGDAEDTNAAKQEETVEKQQEKQEKQGQDQDESSWVIEKPKEEPPARQGRGRAELKQAVVEDKAVELKPDEEQESFWGADDKKQKQKSVEKPREAEERGRGRGNRDGQEEGQRGGRNYERNYRNNDQGEGERRGNRDGNHEWRGNRGGYNTDRGGRNYGDRGGERGNQRPDRGDRGDRGERGGERGGDRNERGGDRGQYRGRGRGGYNGSNFNRNFQNNQELAVQQATQQKKNEVPVSKARKGWPECNIYIFGIKLCITFRRIQDFKCKLLVVPFKTPKLQFYPGNIVNQSPVNYKEKIAKKEELKQGGETYFQKAQKVADFEALAFLKIDELILEDSLTKGIKQIFERVEGIDQASLQSVVFSFCEELGDPRHAIQEVIKGLQQTKKIKSFYINTISQSCFLKCIEAFMQEMKFLFEENELSIE